MDSFHNGRSWRTDGLRCALDVDNALFRSDLEACGSPRLAAAESEGHVHRVLTRFVGDCHGDFVNLRLSGSDTSFQARLFNHFTLTRHGDNTVERVRVREVVAVRNGDFLGRHRAADPLMQVLDLLHPGSR